MICVCDLNNHTESVVHQWQKRLTWRLVTQRTNQWRKGSEIYWICSGQPVSCRLIARKLSAPQTSTVCRSPETVCRIYCISPFWLPCNSNFIYKRVHKNIYLYIIHMELTEVILEARKCTFKQQLYISYNITYVQLLLYII